MFFVVNTGSSSVKSVVYTVAEVAPVLRIRVDGIGGSPATLSVQAAAGIPEISHLHAPDARAAIGAVLDCAALKRYLPRVTAAGHRVVHGGARFVAPTTLSDDVRAQLAALADLAPLHNGPALQSIDALRAALPDVPHVAVFDTAFHATLPEYARAYPLPREWVERFDLRRYGFHGTSHRYVAGLAAKHLRRDARELRIVSCHLGSGASVAAIAGGRSIDTSMGMTPLEGLMMATRAGDLDPGILLHLLQSGHVATDELAEALNHRSGFLGMAGTADAREVEARAATGDDDARGALEVFAYRVRKYIGAYAAAMGGIDGVVFTGGIGERSAGIRARIVERLEFLGLSLDADLNRRAAVSYDDPVADVSRDSSPGRILVVATDEECAIAQEMAAILPH